MAWFNVPPGAEGFTCLPVSLELEDLGPGFGVIARQGSPVELHVLKGRDRVHPLDWSAECRDLHSGGSPSWEGSSFGGLPRTARRRSSSSTCPPVPGPARFATLYFPPRVRVFDEAFGGHDDIRLDGKKPDPRGGPPPPPISLDYVSSEAQHARS